MAAPTWKEVSSKPEFKALAPEDQEATRNLYWKEVVMPQVDTDQLEATRKLFDEDTAPTITNRIKQAAPEYIQKGIDFVSGAVKQTKDDLTQPRSVMEGMDGTTPAPSERPAEITQIRQNGIAGIRKPSPAAEVQALTDGYGFSEASKDLRKVRDTEESDAQVQDVMQRTGASPQTAANIVKSAGITAGSDSAGKQALIDGTGSAQNSSLDWDARDDYKDAGIGARGLKKGVEGFKQQGAGLLSFFADTVPGDWSAVASTMDKVRDSSDNTINAIGDRGTPFEKNLESAISSTLSNAPGLIGGVLTGSEAVPLFMMGAQTFGDEWGNGKKAGLSYAANMDRAALMAAYEIVGEKIGMGDTLRGIKASLKGASTSTVIEHFAKAMLKEIPGEQLTTAGQFGYDKFSQNGLNKEATLNDYVKAVKDTFIQTMMQSGMMMGGGAVTSAGINKAHDLATGGEQGQLGRAMDAALQDSAHANNAEEIALQRLNPNAGIQPAAQTAPFLPPKPTGTLTRAASIAANGIAQQSTPFNAVPASQVLGEVEPEASTSVTISQEDQNGAPNQQASEVAQNSRGFEGNQPAASVPDALAQPAAGEWMGGTAAGVMASGGSDMVAERAGTGGDAVEANPVVDSGTTTQALQNTTDIPATAQPESPAPGAKVLPTAPPVATGAPKPYKSQAAARMAAGRLAKKTGEAYTVEPHPAEQGSFAIVKQESEKPQETQEKPQHEMTLDEFVAHQKKLYKEKFGVDHADPAYAHEFNNEALAMPHLDFIETALEQGKTVPPSVLHSHGKIDAREYPLAAKLASGQQDQSYDLNQPGSTETESKPAAKPPRSEKQKANDKKPADRRKLDTDKDSISMAVRKLGGISKTDDLAGEIRDLKFGPSFMGHVWKTKGGIGADQMARLLAGHGYLQDEDVNELFDKLREDHFGNLQLSSHRSGSTMEAEYHAAMQERDEEAAQFAQDAEIGSDYAPLLDIADMLEHGGDQIIDDGQSYILADLFAQAKLINEGLAESIMERSASDAEVARQLKEIIDAEQEADTGAAAGAQAQDRGVVQEERQPAGTEGREDFALSGETEGEIADRDKRLADAEKAKADETRKQEEKAKADSEVGSFTLTGSDRPADSNPGQGDLVIQANEIEKAATKKKAEAFGSANQIFTQDAADKAREILKKKLGQVNTGIDPEVLQAGLTLAGYHIEKGARSFAAYAKAMIEDMGDIVKPYLKSWYMGIKYDPRAAAFAGDMTGAAEVEAHGIDAQETEAANQLDTDFRLHQAEIVNNLTVRGKIKALYQAAGVRGADAFSGLPMDDKAAAYVRMVESGEKPVEIKEGYNAMVKRMEREAEIRRLQEDSTVRQRNGKPFKTEASATKFQNEYDLTDTHEVAKTEGGFELKRLPPARRPSVMKAIAERQAADPEMQRQEAAFARAKEIGSAADDIVKEYENGEIEIDDFEREMDSISAREKGDEVKQDEPPSDSIEPPPHIAELAKHSVEWLRKEGGESITVSDAIMALNAKYYAITENRDNWTPRDNHGHPINDINLYKPDARRKLDEIGWAITNLMEHRKRNGEGGPKDEQELSKQDATPLSDVIDAVNKKHGSDLGYADRIHTLAVHDDLFKRIREGEVSADEFKASFEALLKNKDAIIAELSGLTKSAIFDRFPGLERRYKNEKKDRVVDAAFSDMASDFVLGQGFSYGMGRESYIDGIRAVVNKTTDKILAEFSEGVKQAMAERVARSKEIEAGMENPQTLDDYTRILRSKMEEGGKTYGEARMELPPEQRARYDELAAEKSRGDRKALADQQRTEIRVASTTTDGQVIETRHTKTGEPLFVVKAAERVERDVYNHWNATAKRLGGWYSSYRGGGAVPGFQFKTRENADAFLQFIGGDAEQAKEAVQTRRDAFDDDRSQTAVERLTEMADKLDERADESLGRERKANTQRRARFAASAEAAANSEKAMAQTMRNIAKAIEEGRAKFLDLVRQKVQIEMLQGIVTTAQYEKLRTLYPSYAEQEKHRGEKPTAETADYVTFPTYTAFRSDLASLGRALLETEGTNKLGQRIMKVADDVTDAYLKFAKENLHKVSTFGVKGGGRAVFASKQQAENAIHRSGYKGSAIILPFKRGENIIILSPSEAVKLGIWEGDDDKRITLSPEFGSELVEKIGKAARRGSKISVPWQFETVYEKRKRLAAIGIETPAELRAAVREFISLREAPKEADKIKQMERAMIGRRNDGLDFFPTPASVVDEMVETADIRPGMSVLEPSAGMGHIAERIREAGVDPDVVELSGDRRELLEAKGFRVVGHDFMDMDPRGFTYGDVFRAPDGTLGVMRGSGGLGSNRVGLDPLDENGNPDPRRSAWHDRDELVGVRKRGHNSGYDRILMNPPFSDGRAAQHVRHAYDLLKPGGRLVAIVDEGVFFRSDKKTKAFREWLDEVGGTDEKLAEGTFLDSSLPVNTGVNARMVVINKSGSGEADVETAAKFSRTPSQFDDAAAASIQKSDIAAMVDRVTQSWKNAPAIEVVQSVGDLPNKLRDQVYSAGADSNAEGMFLPGSKMVYLVADNIADMQRAEFVLLHEAKGHYGLRGVFGEKLTPILRQIWSTNQEVRRAAKELMEEHGYDRDLATEEALANLAGDGMAKDLNGWKKLVAFVLDWLRRHGFVEAWSDDDVQALLAKSGRYVEEGGTGKYSSSGGRLFSKVRHDVGEIMAGGWRMLSGDERIYQNNMPDSFDMGTAAKEIDPGMSAVEDKPDLDEEKQGIVKKWYVKMPDKTHAYVYENKAGEVWLDASRLGEGVSGGTKLYLLVGSYAEGNGKVFIGDPAGLSDVALIRRTENMLSLAMRFGTTGFMMPHEYQMNPHAKLDSKLADVVRPINWDTGDDENNLSELLKTSYTNTINLAPEIRNVTYNFDKRRFEYADGQEFTKADFDRVSKATAEAYRIGGLRGVLARAREFSSVLDEGRLDPLRVATDEYLAEKQARNAAKPAQAGNGNHAGTDGRVAELAADVQSWRLVGSATLKRAAITNTLAREARGGKGRQLLAGISQFVRGGLKESQIEEILYSKASATPATQPPESRLLRMAKKSSMGKDASVFDHILGGKFLFTATGADRLISSAYDSVLDKIGEYVPETVKAGMVSDYGLDNEYLDRKADMKAAEAAQSRKTAGMVEMLAGLTRAESRVAYLWMQEKPDSHVEQRLLSQLPESSRETLAKLKQMISDLSKEAVRLGQLSGESHARNDMAYLHRTYAKHVLDQEGVIGRMLRTRSMRIKGNQYKGRGIFEEVGMGRIHDANPDFWKLKLEEGKADSSMKGEKLIRIERRDASGEAMDPLPGMTSKPLGKLRDVAYWPASEPVPAKFGDWVNAGEWEVRDVKGDKLVVWRDLTREERDRLGELDEVRYAVAQTLQLMVHDIEVGKFFSWAASQYGKAEAEGPEVSASENLGRAYGKGEWVRVPSAYIPGTKVRKYGALAGLYVPGPVWNDLRQTASYQAGGFAKLYGPLLRFWKKSKTAWSPSVHMNNVIANFVMADWHDMRAADLAEALRVWVNKDKDGYKELFSRFEDSGALGGMFSSNELLRDEIKQRLEEMKADLLGEQLADSETGKMAKVLHLLSLASVKPVKAVGNAMTTAYQNEDAFFRLAVFLKAVRYGKSDREAGKMARYAFLNYDINAPWVQAARHSVLPFVSFAYRALPMALDTAKSKPWKVVKLMAFWSLVNALGSASGGGDDDRHRRMMAEEKQGRVWGMVPKMVRMPWNDEHGAPVYLDIRRWIPVGDVADLEQGHGLPPPIVPGGPMVTLAEILLFNKSLFTDKEIVKDTDTVRENALKKADYLFKALMPNVPVPNPLGYLLTDELGQLQTYGWAGIEKAVARKENNVGEVRTFPQAVLNDFGVKVGAYPEKNLLAAIKKGVDRNMTEIDAEIKRIGRDFSRLDNPTAADREKMQRALKVQIEKKKDLVSKVQERIAP